MPVSIKIMSELLKFKNQYPQNINGRLFKQCSTLGMSRALLPIYKNLGFNISVHELRHTYATMLISNGIDFKTAAKLLGHDIEQTMKTYTHVTDDMISAASKIINNIF